VEGNLARSLEAEAGSQRFHSVFWMPAFAGTTFTATPQGHAKPIPGKRADGPGDSGNPFPGVRFLSDSGRPFPGGTSAAVLLLLRVLRRVFLPLHHFLSDFLE
jgi:hypothetical protein